MRRSACRRAVGAVAPPSLAVPSARARPSLLLSARRLASSGSEEGRAAPDAPAVVLLSGGLDSTTLLHYVIKKQGATRVHALSFDYNQKHKRELTEAAWQCAQLPEVFSHTVVNMGFLGSMLDGASALIDGPASGQVKALIDLDKSTLDQPETYVPNRNMMFLSLAASFAESKKCRDVYYAAQAQDEYGYWDCTVPFLERVNGVLKLNRRDAVTIRAPFITWRKTDELKLGFEMGVDYGRTWTCYRGLARACGVCPSCVERLKAFKEVGREDPLDYDRRLQ